MMSESQKNGHCDRQEGGCTEFVSLKQEVEKGLAPKVKEVEKRSKKTEDKVESFDKKLNKIFIAVLAAIVTIIVGSGSIIAAILNA